jgi:hypothetical protein
MIRGGQPERRGLFEWGGEVCKSGDVLKGIGAIRIFDVFGCDYGASECLPLMRKDTVDGPQQHMVRRQSSLGRGRPA